MPFTSPAALRPRGEVDASIRGYAVVFRRTEADWVVEWYEELTGINLPDHEEWLVNAQDRHDWFATFVPSRGEAAPPTAGACELGIQEQWHTVERIDQIHGVLGAISWVVLAGEGDAPAEPS